jgi:hypothetical protein
MPTWFKRTGPLFGANTVSECDIVSYNGKLIVAAFNRAPMAQEVLFYDVSDIDNPALLATRPWAGAMGGMLVDASGNLHIYGASPPAQNNPPFNSIIHSSVDSSWNLSAPNTILGPSGMGFNNITVAKTPLGYVLAVEQAYPDGTKAESYIKSPCPCFSTFTVLGSLTGASSDFTGKSRIRHNPGDGWTYITSDAIAGYTKIARTHDFASFQFSTSPHGFLGPDFGDAFPGVVGGDVFYNGNVSWEEWSFEGKPCVIAIFFQGNEVNTASYRVAVYHGALQSLFSEFTF